jgi:hypothetical protein
MLVACLSDAVWSAYFFFELFPSLHIPFIVPLRKTINLNFGHLGSNQAAGLMPLPIHLSSSRFKNSSFVMTLVFKVSSGSHEN